MSEKVTCEGVAHAALGEPLKRSGHELFYRCPHPERHRNGDEHPSLQVNPERDVWMCGPCRAGGKPWSLAAFLGNIDPNNRNDVVAWLRNHNLLSGSGRKARASERGRVVATYLYKDMNGAPVARKLRFEPGLDGGKKSFIWERYQDGEWVAGLGAVQTPLYRVDELNDPSGVVLYVEGEKCSDSGWAIGLQCVTAGGVNSFRPDHVDSLLGLRVCVIPDADQPGRADAQRIVALLHAAGVRTKLVELPYHDLADAIAAGMTREQVLDIVLAAPEWKPPSGAELIRRFEELFCRHIVAPKGASLIAALYAHMTHAFKAFSWIPYLTFSSPLESCGKSRAADITGWACARPEILVSITEAALFRLVTEQQPTVVIDEAEVLHGDGETAASLRAVLHAGCSPDDIIFRCAPNTHKLERFSPWCPKIFCAIGRLPRVLESRCIVITMQRKKRGEKIKGFIRDRVKAELVALGAESRPGSRPMKNRSSKPTRRCRIRPSKTAVLRISPHWKRSSP